MLKGDLEQAERHINESLTLRQEIGDRGGIAWCMEKLAEIALIRGQQDAANDARGEFLQAAKLFGAAEAIREPLNSQIDTVDLPEYQRRVTQIRDHLGESAFKTAWDEGRGKTLEQAIGFALNPL